MTPNTKTWTTPLKQCVRSVAGLCYGGILACGPADSGRYRPTSVLKISTTIHSRLVENSVAVTSVSQPGIIFGLNDSGHDALIFAYDSTGTGRGVWKVMGARNLDWEAAALGPCTPNENGRACLYIGDVGDNDARKSRVTIYRVKEPDVPASIPDSLVPVLVIDRLDIRYSDHPHDVEAMYVSRDGSLFLITKRRLLDAARRPRPALIFRVPASHWDSSGIVTAALVDSLPIVPGKAEARQVVDAALSPDGKLLAVRTYAEVYVFAIDSATGLPATNVAPTFCTIVGLDEKQGEGIGWWWDGRRLLLTSEGKNSAMYVVACPLPES